MAAPAPDNELARLQALRDLDVLDTPPEESFDRVTRLASQILNTPIALVSLIDEDRQWFKSEVGLGARETPREHAFCAHTILDVEVMVVNDATQDARFADNPLVLGSPDIRFYAGAPLMLDDDIRLGTLCAIDTKPREITADEIETLRDLAAIVVDELKLRHHLQVERQLVDELNRQTLDLEVANDALGQFAYMASHDLRAPLKNIINLADIALDDGLDDDASELVSLIRLSGVRLESLVVSYWKLAQLQRSEDETHSAVDLIEKSRVESGLATTVTTSGDAEITGDPALLTQALTNLIANASVHGADDAVAFAIDDRDGFLEIRATNSTAAAVDVDQSLFLPFQRGNANGESTGLGLAIVDRIMRVHGGTATAEATADTFTVVLQIPMASNR